MPTQTQFIASIGYSRSDFILTMPRLATMQATAILDAVINTKGDIPRGVQLFTQLGCVACHTVASGEPPKGPFLGTISSTYKERRDLAENILLPSKTIAQGFDAVAFGAGSRVSPAM